VKREAKEVFGMPKLLKRKEEQREGKREAEAKKKYFGDVKFSTQVLISLWKRRAGRKLTCHSSTK
jgi:hypothetical protein